jgi:hypothetical protein
MSEGVLAWNYLVVIFCRSGATNSTAAFTAVSAATQSTGGEIITDGNVSS